MSPRISSRDTADSQTYFKGTDSAVSSQRMNHSRIDSQWLTENIFYRSTPLTNTNNWMFPCEINSVLISHRPTLLYENEVHPSVCLCKVDDDRVIKFVLRLKLQKESFLYGHKCQSSQAFLSSCVPGVRLDALQGRERPFNWGGGHGDGQQQAGEVIQLLHALSQLFEDQKSEQVWWAPSLKVCHAVHDRQFGLEPGEVKMQPIVFTEDLKLGVGEVLSVWD